VSARRSAAWSVQTYLGLLACTGMRPRELLRLTGVDVDTQANALTVRQTKFSKSRYRHLRSDSDERGSGICTHS
jgi:integrase